MAPRDATVVSGREQKILDIIETTRAKRPKFKVDQVTMAHGAGGKATQSMIEGLFVPDFAKAGGPREFHRPSRNGGRRSRDGRTARALR